MNTSLRTANIVGADARTRPVWRAAAGVVGFAVAIALAAHVAVPVPGTPVPATLQTLAVLLAALALGPRLAVAAVALYLALGLTGWPVFALGKWASAGYLAGFLLAPPVIAAVLATGPVRWWRTLAALLAGEVVIFAAGVAGLAVWTAWIADGAVQAGVLLGLGVLPFVPGEVLKLAIALSAARAIQRH